MKKALLSKGIFAVLAAVALLTACKKEGLGGKGEIKGYAMYNGKVVKPTTFYIKYGATSSPGTDVAKYDASTAGDGDGKFNFKELNKGDYFIYAIGTENGQTMTGGTYVELTKDEIKDNVGIVINP